ESDIAKHLAVAQSMIKQFVIVTSGKAESKTELVDFVPAVETVETNRRLVPANSVLLSAFPEVTMTNCFIID
ncbi:MAG: hypothetical protein AAGF28_06150, partial [Pseudomonadota bacterium]